MSAAMQAHLAGKAKNTIVIIGQLGFIQFENGDIRVALLCGKERPK